MEPNSLSKKVGPYGYILPVLLVFVVFLFYPSFKTIYLGLYKTNKMGQAKLFVGLGNHMEPFWSESFYNSLAMTLLFVAIVVAGGMALGLLAAVLCNKAFPGICIFSTAHALLVAIVSSSVTIMFKTMLRLSIGTVNKLLGLDTNWISDPKYALICVTPLTAWLNSGINFLYFNAEFSNIGETIYKRASVDGVDRIQKFSWLTLSGLSPIMSYTIVVNTIQAFQSLNQMKILTQDGSGESTDLIVYSIHRSVFFNYRFDSTMMQSVIPFVIVMVVTLMMFKIEKKGVSY